MSFLSNHRMGVFEFAFGASREARVLDVDAYKSNSHPLSDIPCKALSIGLGGSVASARLVDRSKLGFTSPRVPRMPKDTIQPTRFCGRCAPSRLYSRLHHSFESIANNPGSQISNAASYLHRYSFASRIVDFQIPESRPCESRWTGSSAA